MGCEGYLTIKRIGDGQHLLKDWMPRFVVHVDQPIAVLNVSRNNRLYRGSSLRPWTTHVEEVDKEAVDIEGVEGASVEQRLGYKALVVPLTPERGRWQKAIVVASRIWLERDVWPDAKDRDHVFSYDWADRVAIWDKITPGLWVVTRYSESGTDDSVFYSCDLPTDCQVTDTLNWELWT